MSTESVKKWRAAQKTLARVKLNRNLLLRIDRHADRYGDRLVRLRVTAYEWGKYGKGGMHYSGEESLTLPASTLGEVIAALQQARAAMEARQSQSHVAVRRDNETRHPELRAKALELHSAGKKPEDIAADLGIGRATVYRWLRDSAATAPKAPSEAGIEH